MHVLAQVTAYDTYSAIFYFITLYFKSMSCNKNFINCNFFFFLFRAILMAYGGSQAKGGIRATAAGLHHSHSSAGSEQYL